MGERSGPNSFALLLSPIESFHWIPRREQGVELIRIDSLLISIRISDEQSTKTMIFDSSWN